MRNGSRKYFRNHKMGNIGITIVIYGLSAYLLIGFVSTEIRGGASENLCTSILKSVVYGKETEILQEESAHSGCDMTNVIMSIASTPVSTYTERQGAKKELSQVNFYLQEESGISQNEETVLKTEQQAKDSQNTNPDNTNQTNKNEGTDVYSDNRTEPKADVQQDVGDLQEAQKAVQAGNQTVKSHPIEPSTLTYDFLMKNYYTVVSATSLRPEDMDIPKMMSMDMKMKTKNDSPQILIYHTHGQEGFCDSVQNDPSTRIIGVGDYLVKLLQDYGYNVIHITDSFDYVNGVFDRSKAYDYAYDKIAQVLADNPSIEMVIDLHRDGVAETTHLVTEVNGKQTAQIMFFNGISRLNSVGEIGYLYNPYRTENLALSLQMKVLSEEYFHGFARRNYIQAYQYNLHLRPKSMLIEAGAQTNTFEEVKNAMEPLAFLLHECLGNPES